MSDIKVPTVIYLIDDDPEPLRRSWCDSPDPEVGMDAEKAIKYVLHSELDNKQAEIDALKAENERLWDAKLISKARPISELHEEINEVVVMRLRDETGEIIHEPPQDIANVSATQCDVDWDYWDCFFEVDFNSAFDLVHKLHD